MTRRCSQSRKCENVRRKLSILYVLTVICVSLFAFDNELEYVSDKNYITKEKKLHYSLEPRHGKSLRSHLTDKTVIKSLTIIDEINKLDYYPRDDTLIVDLSASKTKLKKFTSKPIKSLKKSSCGKSLSKSKKFIVKPTISLRHHRHEESLSKVKNTKLKPTLKKKWNRYGESNFIFIKSSTIHRHGTTSGTIISINSHKYALNPVHTTTPHSFNSKLKNVSIKFPFEFLKKSWYNHSTNHVVSTSEPNSKLLQTTINETTRFKTDYVHKSNTSPDTNIPNNENALKLITLINSNFSNSNNSLKSINFVKKYNDENGYTTFSNIVPKTTHQDLKKIIRGWSPKSLTPSSSKTDMVNLTSPVNCFSSKCNNSLNSSVNFFKKQWNYKNGTNFINIIKNIYQSNGNSSKLSTKNNTYSIISSMLTDRPPIKIVLSNSSLYYNISVTTSLPNIPTSALFSGTTFTKNFHIKNLSTNYNLTTSKPHLNLTAKYSTLNKNTILNISEKHKVNNTVMNLNKSDDTSWFSSIFLPVKNLWFLWSEPNKTPTNRNIMSVVNNTANQTEDDNQPAMCLGSLNNSNVTLLLPTNENRNKTDAVFYTSNITSLANLTKNSSDPTIIIANDTLVSVIANGSHMHPEAFKGKGNGTWLGHIKATVVHWMGDVYDCITNHIEPVSFKDIRFFLYTRNNSNNPEEIFLKLQDITTTTEGESGVSELVNDTNMNATLRSNEYKTVQTSTNSFTVATTQRKDLRSTSTVSGRKKQKNRRIVIEKHQFKSEHRPSTGKKIKHVGSVNKTHKRPVRQKVKDFIALNSAKSVHSKFFNVLHPTKIIIHGYTQSYLEDSMVKIREAYLSKLPFNIIMVDWSSLSHSPCYPMVTKQSRNMGVIVSHLLEQLALGGTNMATVHIIGFSIGAQIAGFAGAALGNGEVYRVTGLDPASPFFDNDPGSCLDATDATFVDVVHTSAGFLGQPGPIGHADFYPNGGSQQPGCDFTALACSHDRAALYFAESILSDTGFPAIECTSWDDFQRGECNSTKTKVLMGDPCLTKARGTFYLTTGEAEPFSDLQQHNKTKKSLFANLF